MSFTITDRQYESALAHVKGNLSDIIDCVTGQSLYAETDLRDHVQCIQSALQLPTEAQAKYALFKVLEDDLGTLKNSVVGLRQRAYEELAKV